ncbi:MAG: ribonuclease P protein component [Bdellovibrionaceae bacterium]|nr:ribonuclease P protein component [Pseudobdellovibrionaceae bacterium]|tara:strand:+ start:308 stop:694 length:387 start_codon:yes stop_codon:yes gene_type:complete
MKSKSSQPLLEQGAFLFPPSVRLHHKKEYLTFFRSEQVYRLKSCVIFRVRNSYGHFRLGMSVTSKFGSVKRNQVKRVVREAFRLAGHELGSYDYHVVVSKKRNLEYPYLSSLKSSMKVGIQKIRESVE